MVRPIENEGRVHLVAVRPDLHDIESFITQVVGSPLRESTGCRRVEDLNADAHAGGRLIRRADAEDRAGDLSADERANTDCDEDDYSAADNDAALHPSDLRSSTLSGYSVKPCARA